MTIKAVVLGLAVIAVMFTIGRLVPRSRSEQQVSPTAPRLTSERPMTTASGPPEVLVIGGRRMERTLVEATQRDPEAANRTRQVVTTLLEGRRHLTAEIDGCFAKEPQSSLLRVRFAVDVTSTPNELTVNDARYISVVGATEPLEARTAECLERHLAGHEVAEADDDAPFLADYAGPIEYVAAFARPSQ